MRCDHNPLPVTRRTESADKSDALQTLRAVRRRPAVAKRLECVRLQRRFPKAACDSMVGSVHGVKKLVVIRFEPQQTSSLRHNPGTMKSRR
jgi:hypothetical protein